VPVGQRSSIAFIISSAHRTASAIALIVAGTLRPASAGLKVRITPSYSHAGSALENLGTVRKRSDYCTT
jgi:hypothetical protein